MHDDMTHPYGCCPLDAFDDRATRMLGQRVVSAVGLVRIEEKRVAHLGSKGDVALGTIGERSQDLMGAEVGVGVGGDVCVGGYNFIHMYALVGCCKI